MEEITSPPRDLCNGDFFLVVAGKDTHLIARFPFSGKCQISAPGNYCEWGDREWGSFAEVVARRFRRPDVNEELRALRAKLRRRRMLGESSVVDDDRDERRLEAVHTLEMRHSQSHGYIRITGGGTFSHRAELRNLGLRWNPASKAWEAQHSDRMLELARRFVEANDAPSDPAELGYARCSRCGRWIPEGSTCACT